MLGVVGIYTMAVLGVGALGIVMARRNASGPPPPWATALRLDAGRWRGVQRWLRRMRSIVAEVRAARLGLLSLAYLASVVHILLRILILPLLVFALGVASAPLAALVLWPLALIYGAVVAPIPGGGGLVEVTFKHFLGDSIPAPIFGAALIWWRFYSFYVYVILGALAAGRSVMRALRAPDKRPGGSHESLDAPDTREGDALAGDPDVRAPHPADLQPPARAPVRDP